jgi:ubiquinone/menaquinone biosynthesis C-methylase UbiE
VTVVIIVIAAVALIGTTVVLWLRTHPEALPYGQRFFVELPHPLITRRRLLQALDPKPGEGVLEVGPGTGYYTLDVAKRVGPEGEVAILDVRQEFLDHTMRRASDSGLDNVKPSLADARELPYQDGTFDAAFLVTVLGEVPDQDAALRELRRVLKPGGRLIVGEAFVDPHVVTLGALRTRAEAAGLRFERRVGPMLGYFARFSA